MWFENASGNNDIPPSKEELDEFIENMKSDEELRRDVVRRFTLTRGRRKFISWMKISFFFKNASEDQLLAIHQTIPWKN